ncbi:MarR family winged helix-turn-helix transcriptional regulator [Nocardia sp. NPDC051570]|uniref:MarR family winged helix-turn-helix transcriptional regulator n=1 Tax=Nocardia sp. NPDC051570 TaxID=3364324 RepID=UPI00379F366D
MSELGLHDYASLLMFRTALRRFERWSEQQAREVGLTPAQHQLLLAIKGHPDEHGPTIRDVAEYLVLRHHSAVGLVDRAVESGLVLRVPDATDSRAVRLALTEAGSRSLRALSRLHLAELRRLAPILESVADTTVPA